MQKYTNQMKFNIFYIKKIVLKFSVPNKHQLNHIEEFFSIQIYVLLIRVLNPKFRIKSCL